MPNWKKVITSGSDAALNSLNVTTSLTASGLIYPTNDGDNGDFLLTDGAGNLSFSRSTVFANVKNVSGGELQKGTPVHATGTAGNTSEVVAASASVASTMPATYVLNETLADDAEGLAIITGYINGVNTSTFGEGDVVYVGENGGFTNVKPQGSDNLIQNLGIVNKVDASNGSGYVYGSGRSNDVPNLPEGKVWVGSDTYSVTSSILTLDEDNSQAQITGSLSISSVINAGTDTDKFLVLDSTDNVDFRTGAQVLSDIGGTSCTGTVTSVTSDNVNTITIGGTSTDPTVAANTAAISNGGTNLATGDQIYDHVTTRINGLTSCVGTVTSVTAGAGMTQTGTSTINPTLNVIGGTAITVNADNIEVTAACNTAWNAKTTCTGTVTGTGANNRVATWSGTTSLDSSANFTYDGTTLTVGSKATIGSSHSNTGTLSTIAGGTLNTSSGACGFIGGGCLNKICSGEVYGFIGGGRQNRVDADYGTVGGGYLNCADGNCSFIGGGYSNYTTANGTWSVIAGGYNNCTVGSGTFIGGGYQNCSYFGYNVVVGGYSNYATDDTYGENFIGGGDNNTVSTDYSVIVGGALNTVNSCYSGILGGDSNTVNHGCSFIIGTGLTTTATCYTFMNNACVAGTTRTTTLVETSARKHKECILPLQDQIENVKKLEPVEFQWKQDKTKDIGFIAEEVEKVFPNLVSYEEDGEIHGVQYSKLTTVLVKALQQQQEQIEGLKKEIFIIKNNLDG